MHSNSIAEPKEEQEKKSFKEKVGKKKSQVEEKQKKVGKKKSQGEEKQKKVEEKQKKVEELALLQSAAGLDLTSRLCLSLNFCPFVTPVRNLKTTFKTGISILGRVHSAGVIPLSIAPRMITNLH